MGKGPEVRAAHLRPSQSRVPPGLVTIVRGHFGRKRCPFLEIVLEKYNFFSLNLGCNGPIFFFSENITHVYLGRDVAL